MRETLYLINPWWENKDFKTGVLRPKYLTQAAEYLLKKQALLFVGSRRVGKTTLFFQIINHLLKEQNIPAKKILYILLDHPRFSGSTISDIIELFRKEHNIKRSEKIYVFCDEIQYSKNWEQELKALCDTENIKFFLSGSASALIFQKSAFLTGRFIKIKIEPLDFPEFLLFRKTAIGKSENYLYCKLLSEYLKIGGYPEYTLEQNPRYFADLTESVIFKDIVNLYDIKNPDIVRDLLLLLAARNGYQTSFNKLSKILGITIDTARGYVAYLKQSFLIDELLRYSESRNKRIYAAKKFYCNDNGLLFNLAGCFNAGAAFEGVLFKFFESHYKEVFFYYENGIEIDFVVKSGNRRFLAEAKLVKSADDKKLFNNLQKAAKDLKINKAVVITEKQKERITMGDLDIAICPFWELLIENKPINALF